MEQNSLNPQYHDDDDEPKNPTNTNTRNEQPFKVKYISSPVIVNAKTPTEFRAIVQQLTGKDQIHDNIIVDASGGSATTQRSDLSPHHGTGSSMHPNPSHEVERRGKNYSNVLPPIQEFSWEELLKD
ncbi:hypothetical protein LIER_04984 [Lithospermum erythrorhizon]|uniref:VQ domain-containing protein n=1 Tax=Lithospermum erythrorhizon TaxID=34254 RepID=A0AAV3P3G9_LITER